MSYCDSLALSDAGTGSNLCLKDSVDMGCWCGAFTEGALSEENRESFVCLVQKPADEYDDQHRCNAETSRS